MEDRLDSLVGNRGAIAGNLPTPLVKRFVISTLLTVISQGPQPNAADAGEEMQRQFEKLVRFVCLTACASLREPRRRSLAAFGSL
jgi:hypothetical protein